MSKRYKFLEKANEIHERREKRQARKKKAEKESVGAAKKNVVANSEASLPEGRQKETMPSIYVFIPIVFYQK